MFRTRPPAFAIACVAVWLLAMSVDTLLLASAEQLSLQAQLRWKLLGLGALVVLGILLIVQLPRALQWRPRRSIRPSPDVKRERERIARNLHDQVGSQLVNAIALVDERDPEHGTLMQSLELCLLDLRLLVDSMDGEDDSLADRLARLRHRIQPALDRRGIALHWEIAPHDELALPGGKVAREIAAIVQEAVSNVLQHADATALVIRLHSVQTLQGRAWQLQVADNGAGLPSGEPACHSLGRGIDSMRSRAAVVAGWLELLPQEGRGLCVQLTVPAVQ